MQAALRNLVDAMSCAPAHQRTCLVSPGAPPGFKGGMRDRVPRGAGVQAALRTAASWHAMSCAAAHKRTCLVSPRATPGFKGGRTMPARCGVPTPAGG